MKRPDVELRPLAGPGVAVLLAAALLGGTWQVAGTWLQAHADEFRRARAELAQAASRYRNASDDQEVYEEYAARFLDMSARGWIGPEQRLGWIEALQQINADLKLPTLAYDIGEQVSVGARQTSAHLELQRTPMTLRLGTLHEGDVIDLLTRLQETGKGLLSVEQCDFSRDGDRVRLDAGVANVQIQCALDWYTLRMTRRKPLAASEEGAP